MCYLWTFIFITNYMIFVNNVEGRGGMPMIFDYPTPIDDANFSADEELVDAVPWIGILRVRQAMKRDSVTNVVLVANNIAIGNALEVSKLNFNSWKSKTKVIFLNKKGLLWGCDVENYIIHDEFYKSQNTMAIIKLDNKFKYPWFPVKCSVVPYEATEHIYLIRFSDEEMKLKQIITKMKPYGRRPCDEFYTNEGLDIKSLIPQYYHCFTSAVERGHCVYDAGMAVATNISGKWTLLGISTLGPGCSLPSRFIDFYPYYPWLVENSYTLASRKHFDSTMKPLLLQIPQETSVDRDKYILSFISDDKVVMKLKNDITEDEDKKPINKVDCNEHDKLVYKDEGYVNVKPKQISTAVYSVSLHDLELNSITCVRITIKCTKKSKTKIFFSKGYGQEDLEQMIKSIPYVKRGQTVAPKVLYIQDDYSRMRKYLTTNIWFKFEFFRRADIKVEFFGLHIPPPPTPKTTTTSSTTEESDATTTRRTRPTRTYETHIGNG